MTMPLVAGLSVESMTSHSVVDNYVCMVGWNELQSRPFGPITPDNKIDRALTQFPNQIAKPNFRVRLNFGRYSPIWAGELTGVPSLTIIDPQDGNKGQVPVWWDDLLQLAQANLIARLAEKYDGKIPSIFMGTNMTIYCEPFIRQVGSKETRAALTAAGYSKAIDETSYYNSLAMFDAFQETRIAWAFNPYQYIDDVGSPANDELFTEKMITQLRITHSDAIVQNNSIRVPPLHGSYAQMYAYLSNNPPLSFQTATAARIGDYAKTIEWAINQGAHLVELSPGYGSALTTAQLLMYDKELKANV